MEGEETELLSRAEGCACKTRVAFSEPEHVGNVRHLVQLLRTNCSTVEGAEEEQLSPGPWILPQTPWRCSP